MSRSVISQFSTESALYITWKSLTSWQSVSGYSNDPIMFWSLLLSRFSWSSCLEFLVQEVYSLSECGKCFRMWVEHEYCLTSFGAPSEPARHIQYLFVPGLVLVLLRELRFPIQRKWPKVCLDTGIDAMSMLITFCKIVGYWGVQLIEEKDARWLLCKNHKHFEPDHQSTSDPYWMIPNIALVYFLAIEELCRTRCWFLQFLW